MTPYCFRSECDCHHWCRIRSIAVDTGSSNNLRTNERVLNVLLSNSKERKPEGPCLCLRWSGEWHWCAVEADPWGVGAIYEYDAHRKSNPERSNLSPHCWGVSYQLGCWQDKLVWLRLLNLWRMVAGLSVNVFPGAPYERAWPLDTFWIIDMQGKEVLKACCIYGSEGLLIYISNWHVRTTIFFDLKTVISTAILSGGEGC